MIMRALVVSAVLCLACSSKPHANHKARARELAATYRPKLDAFALHSIYAQARTNKLDTTLPGAAPLTSLDKNHQTALMAARELVDELPSRHAHMEPSKGAQDIEIVAAKLKRYVDQLTALEQEQDTLLSTLEGLPAVRPSGDWTTSTGSAK